MLPPCGNRFVGSIPIFAFCKLLGTTRSLGLGVSENGWHTAKKGQFWYREADGTREIDKFSRTCSIKSTSLHSFNHFVWNDDPPNFIHIPAWFDSKSHSIWGRVWFLDPFPCSREPADSVKDKPQLVGGWPTPLKNISHLGLFFPL